MKTIILKVLRHGLTFVGGAGLVSDNEMEQIAGAVSAVVGVLWSVVPIIWERWQARQRQKDAIQEVIEESSRPPGA